MDTLFLDAKARTFLAVYLHRSFTRAADALQITQPAVSQQMHSLQKESGYQLFSIVGRQVVLTKEGEALGALLQSHAQNTTTFHRTLSEQGTGEHLRMGATRTIGEFTLPTILTTMMRRVDRTCTLVINNTETLLKKLDDGELDFAWIEGAFDKRRYDYRLFSHQSFIAIDGVGSSDPVDLNSLLKRRLFVREAGSGTRAVLEGILADRGLSLDDFAQVDVIDNLNVIKSLVSSGLGISFMYEAAALDRLADGSLSQIPILGWNVTREFNFVFPLTSHWKQHYLSIFDEAIHMLNNRE